MYSEKTTIGERLRAERGRLRLSQLHFARLAGASKHSQIDWEKDRASPNAKALAAFAVAGADVLYILTGRRGAAVPQPEAQRERLALAIEAVDEGLASSSRDMSAKKKAELILAAYDLIREPGEQARKHIIRLVRAA